MAIQAHICPENLGLPVSSQDYFFPNNNNNNNMNGYNNSNVLWDDFLQQKLLEQQHQQLQYQQQQQQQYMIQLHNMQRRNISVNLQPWKKQKLANNAAATTATASTTSSEVDNHRSVDFSQSLSYELEKQGNEIDKLINFQNERLKLAWQAQRKQQLVTIIKKFEAKAMQLIRQKDGEIEEAKKKSMEFQEIINKLEVENQTWQKVALENEAMVLSLNNTIEQLQQQQQQPNCSSSSSNCVDDAESYYDIGDNKMKKIGRHEGNCSDSETGENRGVFGGGNRNDVNCGVCKSRNASILMLPCRHLCSCKDCDVVLNACPVCKSPKMSSIEALIS